MEKQKKPADQLRERIISAMQRDIGISRQLAAPFAESILGCFAGERPYFPARQRIHHLQAIESDLDAGVPVASVAAKHGLSRAHLYRLFPGGLKARSNRAGS
ncbi:hypothetical protein XarjCFBP7645_11295 [Xanthomonas arboricola]|uniref:Mor transcription activator domain-containing protein n=1 Tax=Xanthomonas arboricola TaxID=56448 RepID=A0A2S7AEG4_9XANT|nr:hypothetical protein XarjCFBP7645_11295 [Xanthomonas arboricola]